MVDVRDGLDEAQRLVSETLDAPLVVLAGAGTGKTRAITHRIAHAVAIGRYEARATLAVTFTTRAAGEMRHRLAALGTAGVSARTIHSAALRQAQYFWPQAYGSDLPPVTSSTFGLLARAAAELNPSTALLRDLATEVSWAKSSNIDSGSYPELATRQARVVSGADPEVVARVMRNYERLKQDAGVIDFDDILLCTAALLASNEEIAAQVRAAYRHFVVDEYQDISAIQHTLIKLWVNDRPDICVVGDPNQAIHSFAGAQPRYLLRFRRDWPGAKQVELNRNYRSSPQVLSLANRVIGGRGVELSATRPPGPTPQLVRYEDDEAEASAVAQWLKARHQEGVEWADMAVLYRINAQSPPLEAALAEVDVPYLVRGAEQYYERQEIRQALALVRQLAATDPEQDPGAALHQVLTRCGWTPTAPAGQGAQRERWESLNTLKDLVDSLIEQGLDWAEVAAELGERANLQHAPIGRAVTLATLHSSKGLEWRCVAIVGAREGLIPFTLATTKQAIDEERRLLYVGATRAQEHLRISWATKAGRGKSRFLGDLASSAEASVRTKRVRTLQGRKCRVCQGPLDSSAERKIGRHLECQASYDEEMYERLRAWRLEQAKAQSAPAFVVFTDATLIALAEAAPKDVSGLLRVPGIGTHKAERYGKAVLAIINGE